MLNITDLKKQSREKSKNNHKIYQEILQEVYKRIENKNKQSINFVCFYVPLIMMGKPLFNYEHALLYITRKLEKGGFEYNITDGNKLTISWN